MDQSSDDEDVTSSLADSDNQTVRTSNRRLARGIPLSPDELYARIVDGLKKPFSESLQNRYGFPFSLSNSMYFRAFSDPKIKNPMNLWRLLYRVVFNIPKYRVPGRAIQDYIRFFSDNPTFYVLTDTLPADQGSPLFHEYSTVTEELQQPFSLEQRAAQGFPMSVGNAWFYLSIRRTKWLMLYGVFGISVDEFPWEAVENFFKFFEAHPEFNEGPPGCTHSTVQSILSTVPISRCG